MTTLNYQSKKTLSFARLKSWLNDAWNWIKEKLGIDSKADIENMTLDDFSDKAVKDLTGGKELKVENDLGNKAKNNNFAENNIVNKNGEINYDELNRQTDKILNGTNRINALSLEEEHGRTRGGRRNVEATLLLRGSIGPDGSQQGNTREQQEKILKDYAQREGIWILPETIDTWRPIDDNITTEARVYFDGDNVIKVGYNYLNFYDMPLDWLTNKISLNNFLFPDTSLELIGFTETYGATKDVPGMFFAPVYRQKYVKGHVLSEIELPLLEEEMKRRGFKKIGYSNYFNENYVIGDLHTGNVIITENGNYRFIDTVPYLNTPDQKFGGKREYRDYSIQAND